MIKLENERLSVQFLEPGTIYERTRFDWSGICQQIVLDGETTYCSQEASAAEPGTEGVGLIDEFGIMTAVGYDEIGIGDWFPKIGVGFLQKTSNEPYRFMLDYPMQTAPVIVEQTSPHQVTFSQESKIHNGWGWKLTKTYTINGPKLIIDYRIENTGKKNITTEQYNHNFVAISGQTIGPNYQLQTSFPIKFEHVDGGIQFVGNLLNLNEVPAQYIYAAQSQCDGLQNIEWKLLHQPSGHGLQVQEHFPVYKFALWAKHYVISPEFFVWIDLQSGESQSWRREYTFF